MRSFAQHPDLAEPLREYFDSIRFLYQAATGYRPDPTEIKDVPTNWQTVGDYRIIREIGRGGMGVVYEAQSKSLLRRVALKLLPFKSLLDEKQIARFRNEAQAAGQLHHPHIVPVYAVGCDRGVHYLAMQYIAGQPVDVVIAELRQVAATNGTLSGVTKDDRGGQTTVAVPNWDTAHDATELFSHSTRSHMAQPRDLPASAAQPCRSTSVKPSPWHSFSVAGCHRNRDYLRTVAGLGANIADALQHAHDMGILHRDIKPSNLLLDETGKAWITDFGLAHVPSDETMTMTGDVMGTVRYMSPEQASGHTQFIDQRTDIYSLGITLYELSTLRRAFDTETRDQFLRCVADQEPLAPRRLNPAIPIDLETIILKAIAKEPAQRYVTAGEFAVDLRSFLEGRPTLARRPTVLDRVAKWSRRHRQIVAVAIFLCLFTTLATGLAAWRISAAWIEAESQRARADRQFREAREVVDRFGLQLAQQLSLVPGATQLSRDLSADTLTYYARFIQQAQDDPGLVADLALTHIKAGGIVEQLGDLAAAQVHYDSAAKILTKLMQSSPADRQLRAQLAVCLNNRGMLYWKQGQVESARQDLDEALDIHAALEESRAANSTESQADLACVLCNQALVCSELRDHDRAQAMITRAISIQRQLVDAAPESAVASRRLAVSLANLAAQAAQTEPVQAEDYCREGLAIHQRLVERFPDVVVYENDLALSFMNLGSLLFHRDQAAAAEAYSRAVDLARRVAAQAPSVVSYHDNLAVALNSLGRSQLMLGETHAAIVSFDESSEILVGLVDRYGSLPSMESCLGGVLFNQGKALLVLGQLTAAKKRIVEGNAHQRHAMEQAPTNPTYASLLDKQLANAFDAFLEKAQPDFAAELLWERVHALRGNAMREKGPILLEVLRNFDGLLQRVEDSSQFLNMDDWEQRGLDLATAVAEAGIQPAELNPRDFPRLKKLAGFDQVLSNRDKR